MKKQSWNYNPSEKCQFAIITRMITLDGGKKKPHVTLGCTMDGIITNCGYAWQLMPGRYVDEKDWPWIHYEEPEISDNVLVIADEKDIPSIVYYDAKEMVFRGGFKENPPIAWMALPKPAKPPKYLPTWCNG